MDQQERERKRKKKESGQCLRQNFSSSLMALSLSPFLLPFYPLPFPSISQSQLFVATLFFLLSFFSFVTLDTLVQLVVSIYGWIGEARSVIHRLSILSPSNYLHLHPFIICLHPSIRRVERKNFQGKLYLRS